MALLSSVTLTRPLAARPLPAASFRRVAVCVRATAKPAEEPKPVAVGKSALVDAIAEDAGISKEQAGKAFDAMIGTIEDALVAGERVTIVGFGSFERKDRAERNGRNPSTGAPMTIPAQKTATFKISPALKAAVNGKALPPKPKAATPAPAKPKAAAAPKAAAPPSKPATPPAAKKAAPAAKPGPKK